LKVSLFGDMKWALYPKVRIRASFSSGSSGSHSLGQKRDRSLFHDHDSLLVPPNPCTNIMSTERSPGLASWTTWRPRGSSLRSRDRVRLCVGSDDDTESDVGGVEPSLSTPISKAGMALFVHGRSSCLQLSLSSAAPSLFRLCLSAFLRLLYCIRDYVSGPPASERGKGNTCHFTTYCTSVSCLIDLRSCDHLDERDHSDGSG
jgi:hypothetical protein